MGVAGANQAESDVRCLAAGFTRELLQHQHLPGRMSSNGRESATEGWLSRNGGGKN